MDTPKIPLTPEDALFDVERRIARRADELARLSGYDPSHAFMHWLEAEREFWHDLESQNVAGK